MFFSIRTALLVEASPGFMQCSGQKTPDRMLPETV